MCTIALSLLSQIVGDELVDIAFSFAFHLHDHKFIISWKNDFAALCALKSSIDGCSPSKINDKFRHVMSWIFDHAKQGPFRVQIIAAELLSKVAKQAPDIFIDSEEHFCQLFEFFKFASIHHHPILMTFGIHSIQNLFISLDSKGKSHLLNNYFVKFINCCITKYLDK